MKIFKKQAIVRMIINILFLGAMFYSSHANFAMEESGYYFAGGNGTSVNPYIIKTPEQLAAIQLIETTNQYFELGNDIDLKEYLLQSNHKGWKAIDKFSGYFNGAGYQITGLYIYDTESTTIKEFKKEKFSYMGFIKELEGTISNLGIQIATQGITSTADYVGGIAGYSKGIIENCYVYGSINSDHGLGGLVGYQENGRILKSYFHGGLTSYGEAGNMDKGIGGIVGFLEGSSNMSIKNCYAKSSTMSNYQHVGGLIGTIQFYSSDNVEIEIEDSYAVGNISGTNQVGGLVGSIISYYNNKVNIKNSYTYTNIAANNQIGGIVGLVKAISYSLNIKVENCYAAGIIYAKESVGGIVGCGEFNVIMNINNCYVSNEIRGTNKVGGILGETKGIDGQTYDKRYVMNIRNSYVTGNIIGNNIVGGISGVKFGDIENCYVTGKVTAVSNVGAMVGIDVGGEYYNSCFNIDTTSQLIGISNRTSSEVCAFTTNQMKQKSTYTNRTYPWNFTTDWNINDGITYPTLKSNEHFMKISEVEISSGQNIILHTTEQVIRCSVSSYPVTLNNTYLNTYSWLVKEGKEYEDYNLLNKNNEECIFVPLKKGIYTLEVTVTGGLYSKAIDTIMITVVDRTELDKLISSVDQMQATAYTKSSFTKLYDTLQVAKAISERAAQEEIDNVTNDLMEAINHLEFAFEIKLSKTKINVYIGKYTTLTAMLNPVPKSPTSIVWKSSNSRIATVDKHGKIKGIAQGTVNIIASAEDKQAVCVVTVKPILVNKITTAKKLVLKKGTSKKLTYTIYPSNATNKTVSYKSSNTKIITINSKGIITGKAKGTAKVTITTKSCKKTATCVIVVK